MLFLMKELFSYFKDYSGMRVHKKLLKSGGKISYLLVFIFVLVTQFANAAIYYVSNSGNDANSGTSPDQPWRTLAKVNSFTPSPGDQILFKRGDAWNGTITVNASGTSGSPIVYGAYGTGEKPKIYGSEEITGWTKHSGNIYKASFNSTINQLFIDDIKMKVARTPNAGYHYINSVNSSTQFTSNNINAGIDYTGAKWIGRTTMWVLATKDVISSNSQTLTLGSVPLYDLGVNEGFILCDKLEFLDAPGEWYFDAASNIVYLWTPNGDSPGNYSVRGSVYKNGIIINHKQYLTIRDFEFKHNSEVGIASGVSSFVTFDNNTIFYPDAKGIEFYSGAQSNTVKNNKISGANHFGIHAYTANSTFSDNEITNTALFENLGLSGIGNYDHSGRAMHVEGFDNVIKYNRIINTGYIGIGFIKRNIVEYNFINKVCLTIDDGGGIYTHTGNVTNPTNAGSIIRNNIILNSIGNKEGYTYNYNAAHGIYLDNNSGYITVENNTIAKCARSCIFLHENRNITVQNNTVMDATYLLYTSTDHDVNTFKNNIAYALNKDMSGSTQQKLVGQRFTDKAHLYDYNFYINHYNKDQIFLDTDSWVDPQENLYTHEEWKSVTGQDINSSIDLSPLETGETEELFYNDTKQTKTINLGTSIYRDIYGETITGSFNLEPFTSKILIKTASGSNSNNAPVISNQSFDIADDKQVNEFIGQVVASDPDQGQLLNYSIIQGNEGGMFAIDPATGEIVANTTIQATSNTSIDLVVEVTDNAVDPLSATAVITINITASGGSTTPDVTAPTISSFSIPLTATSLTVVVNSFKASDDSGVTGYLLTESSTAPLAGDNSWVSNAPTSYTFSLEGSNTLYAWTKDAAGNISAPASSTVTITLPNLSPTYSEYLFEESSGSQVIDSQGSNDGIIYNEEIRVNGVQGSGLEFTGSGYINLGNVFGANVQEEVTLSAWIKPSATSSGYEGIIMHGGPNIDSYALYLYQPSKSIGFKTTGTSSAWNTIDNVNSLWDGNWHHLAVTYNGAEKVIYLDNVVIATFSSSGSIESGEGYNLLIGAGRDEVSPGLLYTGFIDEVRVYNYALNSGQIAELYNIENNSGSKTVYASEDVFICEGESYQSWTVAGQYERTLQSSTGGDSIVTTNLYVNPVYHFREEITISEGENYLGWTEPGEYQRSLTSVSGCDSIITTNLVVIAVNNNHFKTVWEGMNGLNHMSLNVVGAYQNGIQLQAGDEIAVFDGSLCVGMVKLITPIDPNNSGSYVQIKVSQDDGSGNGFTEGQVILFKIWDASDKVEKSINQVIYKNDLSSWETSGTFIADGTSVVEIDIVSEPQVKTQTIQLKRGWNIFSSFLIPDNPSMDAVQQTLVETDELFKVQDEAGNTYEKLSGKKGWINNIGDLHEQEGYKIRVKSDCILEITGQELNLPLSIDLISGWNIISFPDSVETNAIDVVQPLIDAGILSKVQDEEGNSIEYWDVTGNWINGIGNFKPGEGYKVEVNKNGILIVNSNLSKSGVQFSDVPDVEYFKTEFEGNGQDHMNINVINLDETGLQIGDEIAAFDGDICVGAVKLTEMHFSNNIASVNASKTDKEIINGFSNGNPIELRTWKSTNNREDIQQVEVINGNFAFNQRASVFVAFSTVSGIDDRGFDSIDIHMYPNPASDKVNIMFSALPEFGTKVILTDITGKQLIVREVSSTNEVLDIQSYPNGMYFVKTVMGDKYKVSKLIKN